MIEVYREVERDAQIVIRPQAALDWARMRLLLCLLTAAIATVAVFFALQGAWLVLPFAGLEVLVVCAAIYLNARRAVTREVVTISGAELVVRRGRRCLVEVGRFPRHWTRLALVEDPRGWYPRRLLLSCHGRRLEIGAVLTDAERQRLAATLQSHLGPWPAARFPEPVALAAGTGTPAYE